MAATTVTTAALAVRTARTMVGRRLRHVNVARGVATIHEVESAGGDAKGRNGDEAGGALAEAALPLVQLVVLSGEFEGDHVFLGALNWSFFGDDERRLRLALDGGC